MTNREFFSAIADSDLSAELKEFALAEIAKLDNRNAKRRNTLTKEQIANEGVKAEILTAIGNGTATASEIAVAVGVSTQKVSALCKQLADSGLVEVSEVKVKGKGTVKGYTVKA